MDRLGEFFFSSGTPSTPSLSLFYKEVSFFFIKFFPGFFFICCFFFFFLSHRCSCV